MLFPEVTTVARSVIINGNHRKYADGNVRDEEWDLHTTARQLLLRSLQYELYKASGCCVSQKVNLLGACTDQFSLKKICDLMTYIAEKTSSDLFWLNANMYNWKTTS